MAPEVYNEKYYTFSADWWSLGILFCKMVTASFPFDISEEQSDYNVLYFYYFIEIDSIKFYLINKNIIKNNDIV